MRQWDSGGRGHWGYRLTHRETEMLNVADISLLILAGKTFPGTVVQGAQTYFRDILVRTRH